MSTYKIVRFYQKHPTEFIVGGLPLKAVQKHCSHSGSSSRTATDVHGVERTKRMGPWFDGYEKESDDE